MRLTEKYRPQTFDQVLGQDKIVRTLKSLLSKDGELPPAILFSGSPGIGKTTLARVIANTIGCHNILELNAADKNSVDDMREILDQISFIPLTANKTRIIILDESHMISKSGWNSILKAVENPAKGTTWIFCSTEPGKIPLSIKSRCTSFELNGVAPQLIKDLLDRIVKEEKFKVSPQIITLITLKCNKSPRVALKYLEMLHDETNLGNAQELIKSSMDGDELPIVLELGRLLKNPSRNSILSALEALRATDEDPQAIRYGLLRYFATVCLRSRSIDEIRKAMVVLHELSKPFDASAGMAPLILALGSVLIE